MELHTIRLGDIAIATNDFELFNDFGTQMKSRSPALQTFVIQLCGRGTYIPSKRASRGGSYSAVIESNVVGAEGGQVLTERTIESIKELFTTLKPVVHQTKKEPIPNVPEPESQPMSPAESMAVTHVRAGYEIQLVAAEPLLKDPVAIAWGADGKLWVVEMADYPMGMDGKGKPGGRIKFLEDSNGDGKYDRSTLFLVGISFPNGIMPWRNGILVTAAPEIFYAEDTNGDGRADKREVLFSGFQEGNQQLRVNGLRWGLDNWVYCASGAHHGGYGADRFIKAVKTKTKVSLGSRDFRFLPDTSQIDPQSGPSQFGRNRDDWGNWFGEQNSHPLWHFVLKDHYIRRNPHFAAPDPRKQIVVPRNPKVYPAKAPQKRFHSFQQSGRFTSACSAMIYRDELLFPRNQNQHAFTCEPFHNLVQHNVITDEGVSFATHRDPAEKEIDFFASKDRWCRPVMARTGPDGALWVVDMYRYMIEHPQWLTPEGREELKPFYRHGDDRGRIYRIVKIGTKSRTIPNLNKLKTSELVQVLNSPNGIQRDLATKILQWKNDQSALKPLEQLVKESDNPLGRLHALCTLDGLGLLTPQLLKHALGDQHAGVRRHAIRLAEPLANQNPELITKALHLTTDPDAKVRLQLAYSLGEWSGKENAQALAMLAIANAKAPYLSAAITSSINKKNINKVLLLVLSERQNPEAGRLVGRLLALSVAFGNHQDTLAGLKTIVQIKNVDDLPWQYETVAGLLDALKRHRTSLPKVVSQEGDSEQKLLKQVATLTAHARKTVFNEQASERHRTSAIRLLGRDSDQRTQDIRHLGELLIPQTPPAIQIAIAKHLGTLSDSTIGDVLLSGWKSHGPTLRAEILRLLATRREWLIQLLDAIEQENVSRADINASTRQTLSVYRDKKIRTRITKLLASSGNADRRKVLLAHQNVLKLNGSATRGMIVFKKRCAACHKLDNVGHDIGPNLRSITDRKPSSLLTSILDPSASVDGKYVTYVAVTQAGLTYTGMLASETGNSITLVAQENKKQTILRSQIDEILSTGKSLMPDGLEKDVTHQDFADLIAYIRKPVTASHK